MDQHLWEGVRWVSGPALVGGGEVTNFLFYSFPVLLLPVLLLPVLLLTSCSLTHFLHTLKVCAS